MIHFKTYSHIYKVELNKKIIQIDLEKETLKKELENIKQTVLIQIDEKFGDNLTDELNKAKTQILKLENLLYENEKNYEQNLKSQKETSMLWMNQKIDLEKNIDYTLQNFLCLNETIERKFNKQKFQLAPTNCAFAKLGIMDQRFETIIDWIAELNNEVILFLTNKKIYLKFCYYENLQSNFIRISK